MSSGENLGYRANSAAAAAAAAAELFFFLSITMHAVKFWLSSYFHARLLRLYFNKLVHFAKLSSVILRLICPLSISRITREGKNPIGLPVDSYVSIRSALFPAFYIMNQLKNIAAVKVM